MYTLVELLEWLSPLVHLAGLVVAGWAYSVSRKRGYILFALYFLLAVINLTVVPVINKARYRHWQTEHPVAPEADDAYFRELSLLQQKYLRPPPPMARLNLPIPLGAAILVAGLWVLACETRKKAAPTGAANATDAAPPTSDGS